MKNRYLNLALFMLLSTATFAQSFYVYRIDNTRVRYDEEEVYDIDYYSHPDYLFVDFYDGFYDTYYRTDIDSICFTDTVLEKKPSYTGNPSINLQYYYDKGTINLNVGELILIRAIAVRGEKPLQHLTVTLGKDTIANMDVPSGFKDVWYINGYFGLDKTDKQLLNWTITDESGIESSTGIWLNTIQEPLYASVPDCFVYYPNSWFHFWQYESSYSSGKGSWWNVSDYDHSTGIATITVTAENGSKSTIKFRRNHDTGALEKVSDGTYYNLTDRSKEFYFLNGYKTKEPSSLLGDMEDKITYKDMGGGVIGVTASEEYHQNKQDRYGWGKNLYNNYRTDLGYTGTSWNSYDNQAGPSATFNFHETLLEYYIERPDGTYLLKRAELPPAPVITGAETTMVVLNVRTGTGGTFDVPQFSFEYNGPSDIIEFVIYTYNPTTKLFEMGLPQGTCTGYTTHYNDRYQKVWDPVYKVNTNDRSFYLRPFSGWSTENMVHYGYHIMLMVARNAAGYGAASNQFYYVINEYGKLVEYDYDRPSSNAPNRAAANNNPIFDNEDIKDAREKLIESLNNQRPDLPHLK